MNRIFACLILVLTSTFAHAQSCKTAAYQDFQDCDQAITKAQNNNNQSADTASAEMDGQGDTDAAHAVRTVALKNSGEWSTAKKTCKEKLDNCVASCPSSDDAQYLNACKNSITQNMKLADSQANSSQTYAAATGAATDLTKSADSKFDDSDINQAARPDDTQDVGCRRIAGAVVGIAAQLAMACSGTAPSSSDIADNFGRVRPAIIQINPTARRPASE